MTTLEERAISVNNNSEEIVDLVRRYGKASSIVTLDPTCEIFSLPLITGLIAYRTTSHCAVVLGDPISSPTDWPALTSAFHDFCEKQGKRVIYAISSQAFKDWATNKICQASLQFGEELILDPQIDPKQGHDGHLLRKKLNHSINEKVVVQEYLAQDTKLEKELEDVKSAWLQGRHGPRLYLSEVDLFTNRTEKRWFYAEKEGKYVGLAMLYRLDAYQGWFLHLLVSTPDAPNGTSELLMTTILETLRQEGCRCLTIGELASEKLGEIRGLGNFSSWLSRAFYKRAVRFFQLNGKAMYWKKFQPESRNLYLLFSKPKIGFSDVLAILRSVNMKKLK